MTYVDEHGRPHPPAAANELDTLLGFLNYQRATLEWRCLGLGPAGLNATAAASTMTLGGMLKHLAYVEHYWFGRRLRDLDAERPWSEVDWQADPDWDWHSAASDSPDELFDLWHSTVDRSRALVAEALMEGDLGQLSKRIEPHDDERPSLRWILVHMIEEYARHNGHADLIREAIDGETGE
ncbi:MAG: DinB family protein [Frankiaceae bacterium]|nr:DinB family protein [Frankiaceae bacterium]